MKTITENTGKPIKAWIDGVPVEDEALEQVKNASKLPFIFRWIALMPDAHAGIGSTIGSVIPTEKAIIPAAVGVDIGCGMCAARLSLKANHLPDNLHAVRSAIEAAVPHGRTDNGLANDRGAWGETPEAILNRIADTGLECANGFGRNSSQTKASCMRKRLTNPLNSLRRRVREWRANAPERYYQRRLTEECDWWPSLRSYYAPNVLAETRRKFRLDENWQPK